MLKNKLRKGYRFNFNNEKKQFTLINMDKK